MRAPNAPTTVRTATPPSRAAAGRHLHLPRHARGGASRPHCLFVRAQSRGAQLSFMASCVRRSGSTSAGPARNAPPPYPSRPCARAGTSPAQTVLPNPQPPRGAPRPLARDEPAATSPPSSPPACMVGVMHGMPRRRSNGSDDASARPEICASAAAPHVLTRHRRPSAQTAETGRGRLLAPQPRRARRRDRAIGAAERKRSFRRPPIRRPAQQAKPAHQASPPPHRAKRARRAASLHQAKPRPRSRARARGRARSGDGGRLALDGRRDDRLLAHQLARRVLDEGRREPRLLILLSLPRRLYVLVR